MLAPQCGIALIDAEACWTIDVAFDGADQVDPAFNLIKGGGGALLKEKIVAASAMKFVVMVDFTRSVSRCWEAPFRCRWKSSPSGGATRHGKSRSSPEAASCFGNAEGARFQTESGNLIVDVHLARIDRPDDLEIALNRIPGVVETGLFVGRTDVLIVGTPDRTETHTSSGHERTITRRETLLRVARSPGFLLAVPMIACLRRVPSGHSRLCITCSERERYERGPSRS